MPQKPEDTSGGQVSETQRLDAVVEPDAAPPLEATPDAEAADQVADGAPRSYSDPGQPAGDI